jgi:hypothetical protein
MDYLDWLRTLVGDAYKSSPILVIALSALIVLPILTAFSFLAQMFMRRRRQQSAILAADRKVDIVAASAAEADGPSLARQVSQAWLTLEGGDRTTMPLSGPLIRIGRHKDNDLRLADSSVHRYHALIQRTPEADFVISDLSGEKGNGVRVNGARTERTQLNDGDVIELGRAKLKFESASL